MGHTRSSKWSSKNEKGWGIRGGITIISNVDDWVMMKVFNVFKW
jgi:hypothetical protein